MKLVHIEGKLRGEVVTLPPLGCCIGRENDNDLVLEDPDVSSYHAKIEQVDGLWRLRDLGSTNGSALNGQPGRDSAMLSEGDVIQTGSKRFVFTSHDSVVLPAAEFSQETKLISKRHRVPLLAGVLVLMLVIVCLAVGLRQSAPPPAVVSAVPENATHLMLRYETLQVTPQNVFRFYLELDRGTLSASVDDLANERQFEREKLLSPEQLAELESIVFQESFLALRTPAVRGTGSRTQIAQLTVRKGRKGNHVAYINSPAEPDFEIVATELSGFAESHLDLAAIAISREELLESAHRRFTHGERLFAERDVNTPNVYLAIEEFSHVLQLVSDLDNRPEYYAKALMLKREAQNLLDKELQDLTFRGQTHRKLGELELARAAFLRIVEMVPDREHPRVSRARKELGYLEAQIEKRRRKR